MELYTASQQWLSRPDDQRFLTLDELHATVARRQSESWTTTLPLDQIGVQPVGDDLVINARDHAKERDVQLTPTNWSFGQLCQRAGAPASYLKTLPATLAGINLQWGMEHHKDHNRAGLILAHENGDKTMTAITSATYGRIWDRQVVESVMSATENGNWQVPAASYQARDPRRATTLYASDRDVFIFLVDPDRPVEVGGECLYRGFMTWNSEVGAASFGLTTFLYRTVCDNRIIWGATDVRELRIRHTGGAPLRFQYEGSKYLKRYANESTQLLESQITAAKSKEIAKDEKGVEDWLRKRGFTAKVATAARAKAEEEEGSARSLWNIIQGITAEARSVSHTDTRVALERKAGSLMEIVAA